MIGIKHHNGSWDGYLFPIKKSVFANWLARQLEIPDGNNSDGRENYYLGILLFLKYWTKEF